MSARTALWTIGGIACLMLLAGFCATAWFSYLDEVEDAERETSNLALVLEEQATRTFRIVEIALRAGARAVTPIVDAGTSGREDEVATILREQMPNTNEVLNLTLVGPDGTSVADALRTPVRLNAADRPFFAVQRDGPAGGIYFSEPTVSRTGRGVVLVASLRLDRRDGQFAGIVAASVSVEYFTTFYSSLALGQGSAILLRNRQNVILAGHPPNAEQLGEPARNSQVIDAVRGGSPRGTLAFEGGPLVNNRIVSYRTVDGTPFIVSVTATRGAIIAKWLPATTRYGLMTVALMTTIAVLVWAVAREVGRRGRADRLSRTSAELATVARDRLVDAIESMPAAFLLFDASNRLVAVNRHHAEIFPLLAPHFVVGASYRTLMAEVARRNAEALSAAGEDGEPAAPVRSHPLGTDDAESLLADGRWIKAITRQTSEGGRVCIYLDETEHHAVQNALLNAQKMEAIGQLTGGLAHDFNNLLTIILGNADLLLDGIKQEGRLRANARMIEGAALRGSALTHRLLAFARRQPLHPTGVDVNKLVKDMEPLLRRTLGEDIDFAVSLTPDLAPALADASQVENALLNLTINSRDAMPQGGTLTVETGNAELDAEYADREQDLAPGAFVMIAVTDTGSGMSPDVLRRVFEPFFTTKEVGKGSGLGLSMVFGFAKQSGGHVKIYSEVGRGTTVRLYLPRAGRKDAVDRSGGNGRDTLPVGHESILVVEDDVEVRALATSTVRSLGYVVHEAGDGPEALAMLQRLGAIDLLFTDVVLPKGMNGPQLVAAMRERQPALRVLYASGYTADAILHQGAVDAGVHLISKPYRRAELAHQIRVVLSAPRVAQ